MWNAMFDLQLNLGEKVIRAAVVYLFLVFALRLVGKRELTQLNTLDFVVLLAVANAVQNGPIGADNTVTGAIAGATVLFLLASWLGWLLYRSGPLRRALEGTSTVLIQDGEVLDDALRSEEMSRDDLLVEIRSARCGHPRRRTHRLAPAQWQGGRRTEGDHQASVQYDDLRARIDHLTELVEGLSRR